MTNAKYMMTGFWKSVFPRSIQAFRLQTVKGAYRQHISSYQEIDDSLLRLWLRGSSPFSRTREMQNLKGPAFRGGPLAVLGTKCEEMPIRALPPRRNGVELGVLAGMAQALV